MKRVPITIAYLGITGSEEDRKKVNQYAGQEKQGQVVFVEESRDEKKSWKERKIGSVMEKMGIDDLFLVPELSRLGKSCVEILAIMAFIRQKNINFHSIREDFSINNVIPEKTFLKIIDAISQLEEHFDSIRKNETYKERTKRGLKIGRPRGPGKSKLDKHRREIIALLKNGSTKAFVARRYNTTLPNLYNWMKKNKIGVETA